jgi:dihydroorotase
VQTLSSDTGGNPTHIRIRMPADLHHHFRQRERTRIIAPLVARRFWLALAMPNLKPPITTVEQMNAHGQEVVDASGGTLRVLRTLYLTDKLSPHQVVAACRHEDFAGIKYYPAGLTTNSDEGVTNPEALWTRGTAPHTCLQVLADHGKVLLLHAADGVARKDVRVRSRNYCKGDELDPYDQEPHFVAHTLPDIMSKHPSLKISFEHLSTGEGAEFMRRYGSKWLGCGLTPQHMLTDRRDTHRRGLRPHGFWFPALQALEHRQEVNRFAGEGFPFCWLASDSAMHLKKDKESECCAGGVITAHAGIELYVEAFEAIGALNKLEAFASVNGPRFYGIEPSDRYIELVRQPWKVTNLLYVDEGDGMEPIHPFRLGEVVQWKLVA